MRPASLTPQPLVACVLTALAVVAVWASSAGTGVGLLSQHAVPSVLVAASLTAALLWTYRLPVEFGYHTKIQLTSVPLYLMAVLLPPPLAALCAGLGAWAGELSVRKKRHNHLSDMATTAARFALLAL